MTDLDPQLGERIAARLERVGQRFTRNRLALVRVLADTDRPLTIPEIAAADASLAMSSIYRNLTTLDQVGVVHRVITAGDHAHYELAEDLTEHHHHHLICSSCGGVEDFEAPARLEQSLQDATRRIGRRTGFRTERHLVDLIGLCADCS
jgi:Fur family transcriptional regulator, ferric uptake regulator